VFLASAFLLAAAAECRGEESPVRLDVPDASQASEPMMAQDNGTAIPAVPLRIGEDSSRLPDNAAGQDNIAAQENADAHDNTVAASQVPSADAGEGPTVAVGDVGEEGDLREPSFGVESPPVPVHDPIEPVNRGIFYVNDMLYRWILKPVAKGYRYVVPEGARIAVRNFFSNLGTPIRAANTLLQGKFKATGTELVRFTINSTFGIAGLFDRAKDLNLDRKDEDTGQTLGVYGLGHGMYVVLPILGPSSARDAVGFVGDTFLDPLTYISPTEVAIGANAVRSETNLSFKIEDIDELFGTAVDPYVAVRDAYIQSREKRVKE
jgi:phospholipid-binding lipoprotein MlaA